VSMTVTVPRDKLLNVLFSNRKKHRQTFERACDVYRERAEQALQELLQQIRDGEISRLYINLPIPEIHLEDYDRAIEMLEWHTDDTIEVSASTYRNFVQDQWEWSGRFQDSTASYVAD
jgi:succinate dehydrogenase/fumarate reductase flavoprotein subunit